MKLSDKPGPGYPFQSTLMKASGLTHSIAKHIIIKDPNVAKLFIAIIY